MPTYKFINQSYLGHGISFLHTSFKLPFTGDSLKIQITGAEASEKEQCLLEYTIPLRQAWLQPEKATADINSLLPEIHKTLSEALLWTNLGIPAFKNQTGEKGDFYPVEHPCYLTDRVLTGTIAGSIEEIDLFKAAMVLSLTMQIALAAQLDASYIHHGEFIPPLAAPTAEAIASILQTAADPTLTTLSDITTRYVSTICEECFFFRESEHDETGYCVWSQVSIQNFIQGNPPEHPIPFWRAFLTHPDLQNAIYNAEERDATAARYHDRIAGRFQTEDQVTVDPITLRLVGDVVRAAKTEDDLQDTETILPRALRLMDFWHSGYLPPSGESHTENPTLDNSLDSLPDSLLPLILSCLTLLPPQHACVGFIENNVCETEVGSMLTGTRSLRDILIAAIPQRVLNLLAVTGSGNPDTALTEFIELFERQASISFERIMINYEEESEDWITEPMIFTLPDILYIQARLSHFVHEITLTAIRRATRQSE